jgi:hypothetical protein
LYILYRNANKAVVNVFITVIVISGLDINNTFLLYKIENKNTKYKIKIENDV